METLENMSDTEYRSLFWKWYLGIVIVAITLSVIIGLQTSSVLLGIVSYVVLVMLFGYILMNRFLATDTNL